ncbi:sulfotransferase [Salinibacter ruber]|uniref:sulfotransferase n=1 Tax=Salinibacter ruber TaxID=146919 RepID=UPI0021673A19|nr:sulfotransferase [Salinibacter ruber]MCS3703580.1 hypothetical protein [Salinibacter ruber]
MKIKKISRSCIKNIFKKYYKEFAKNNGFIFIIGTMRTGSTLLVHLLSQKNEVEAVGENYKSYSKEEDLAELASEISVVNRLPPFGRKVFIDKILHNRFEISNNIINKRNIKKIFLVREPEHVIQSMINMDANHKYSNSVKECRNYYLNRMKKITEYIENTQKNKIILTYKDITEKTDKTLQILGSFINKSKMKKKYETYWHTGKPGVGDPGEKIKSGKIKKNKKSIDIEVPGIKACKNYFRKIYSMRTVR